MSPRRFKDANERRGFEYLLSLGFLDSAIVYEPAGPGKAPDFGLPNGIAVEVTALVEHTKTDAKPHSLVTARKSIAIEFENFLRSYSPPPIPPTDHEWYVSFSFRRPLRKWKTLEPRLKAALDTFASGDKELVRVEVTPEFSLFFQKATHTSDQYFRHSGHTDRDTWGWEQASLEYNVPICLARKATVLGRIQNHKETWLLLVDHISYGSWEQLEVDSRAGWDRIIFITPEGELRSFEPSLKQVPSALS